VLTKLANPKSNLFAVGVGFFAQAGMRLGSSLILTRLLHPEAYGIVTILLTVTFTVEMLADLGVTVYVVREPEAEDSRYLNTAWTLRLMRAALNAIIVFSCAPLIASLYHSPDLVAPLRVIALWFVISGAETMSFPLAVRHNRARIQIYSELVATLLSTLFAIVYCYYFRTYWGMVYAILLNRLVLSAASYLFYPEHRPRLQFDVAASRTIFRYTRLTVPSGLLTLCLTQFDKFVFLRLFDLRALGIYGLASNIATPIETLIITTCERVLYPRCARDFRSARDAFRTNYYTANNKLFAAILALPAAIGGAASLIITVLYDPRYAHAAVALQAFMVRATLLAFATSTEVLLIAAGETQVILIGSLLRTLWVVPASLGGYYLFGFNGFLYGVALNVLPALLYYLWLQRRKNLQIASYEVGKVLFTLAVAGAAYAVSSGLLALFPTVRLRP
jgi:O-antigen/teichoic acid export membrane protein